MVMTSWALLSILTAVLSECMMATTAMQEKEQELDDKSRRKEELTQLFQDLDLDGDGELTEDELRSALDLNSDEFQQHKSSISPNPHLYPRMISELPKRA